MRAPILSCLALLVACGPSSKDDSAATGTPTATTPTTGTGTPTGGSTGTGTGTGTTTGTPVTFPDPTMTLRGTAVGARVHHAWGIEIQSDVEGRLVATIDDGNGHVRVLEPDEQGTDFTATLIGFREDRDYTIEAQLVTPDGLLDIGAPQSFQVTVPPLPGGMPDLTVTVDDGAPRGDTLFGAQGSPNFWILRADSEGHIVWYMDLSGRSLDVTVDPDGRLLIEENGVVARTTWLGDNPEIIQPTGDHIAYHHEVEPGPNGGFFTLAEVHTVVDDLPFSYPQACDPGRTATILDNAIVEFDAAGQVVQEWLLSDLLDTHRIGWGGLALDGGAYDWAHGNAVVWLPAEDALIVSVRSQDTQLKLDRATGTVEWILAPPEGWDPLFEPLRLQPVDPSFRWLYHAHAPEMDGNRMLLFDNGNAGTTPCGGGAALPEVNRVVELEIDETNGTVEQIWAWDSGLFSWAMGDADRLANGNVLAVFGTLSEDQQGTFASRGLGTSGGRFIEVDPATDDIVWEMRIHSDAADLAGGWKTPRAERIE